MTHASTQVALAATIVLTLAALGIATWTAWRLQRTARYLHALHTWADGIDRALGRSDKPADTADTTPVDDAIELALARFSYTGGRRT